MIRVLVAVLVLMGLFSCGGGGGGGGNDSPVPSDSNPMDNTPTGDVLSDDVLARIEQSSSVDCMFLDDCAWTASDGGLTVTLGKIFSGSNRTHEMRVSTSRDTTLNIPNDILIVENSSGAVGTVGIDSCDFTTNFCFTASNNYELTAGSGRTEEVKFTEYVKHKENLNSVAFELSEFDSETVYAVFKNVLNDIPTIGCDSALPCEWRLNSEQDSSSFSITGTRIGEGNFLTPATLVLTGEILNNTGQELNFSKVTRTTSYSGVAMNSGDIGIFEFSQTSPEGVETNSWVEGNLFGESSLVATIPPSLNGQPTEIKLVLVMDSRPPLYPGGFVTGNVVDSLGLNFTYQEGLIEIPFGVQYIDIPF